jgi:hypothetical protein
MYFLKRRQINVLLNNYHIIVQLKVYFLKKCTNVHIMNNTDC